MPPHPQGDLFGDPPPPTWPKPLPEGFVYAPDVLDAAEEAALVDAIRALPFAPFEFHGYLGKRRTVSFGWRYDFATETLHEGPPIPDVLLPARERAAAVAALAPEALGQALVTEYEEGAGIGWHRDKAVFGDVVGVSLLAPCRFRFRRKSRGLGWDRAAIVAEPRSVYVLRGPSRTEWEHGIPPLGALRYSITFRTLRAP